MKEKALKHLKLIFINDIVNKFEEQDVSDLQQFFLAVINIGLKNKNITNKFLEEFAK